MKSWNSRGTMSSAMRSSFFTFSLIAISVAMFNWALIQTSLMYSSFKPSVSRRSKENIGNSVTCFLVSLIQCPLLISSFSSVGFCVWLRCSSSSSIFSIKGRGQVSFLMSFLSVSLTGLFSFFFGCINSAIFFSSAIEVSF